MLQVCTNNTGLLKLIYKIPIVNYFFIVKINAYNDLKDERLINNFLRFLYVTDGPSKQTNADRFNDINQITLKYAQEIDDLKLHDTGVSTGITSLQLYKMIKESGKTVDFNLSDKFSKYTVKKGGLVTKVYDAAGNLNFGYILFAVASKNIKRFFLSRWLFSLLKRMSDGQNVSTISLYHPLVNQAIVANEVADLDYDVFETEIIEQYNYVRCMNVLITSYFSDEMIVQGIKNLTKSLVEGGILQVGRTHQNSYQNVTFYRKESTKLIKLENVNDGCEVEELVEKANNS